MKNYKPRRLKAKTPTTTIIAGNEHICGNGDINADGITDIKDIVKAVEYMLNGYDSSVFPEEMRESELVAIADNNKDGFLDMIDIINLVKKIVKV